MFANQLNLPRSLTILLLVVLGFTSIGSTFDKPDKPFPDIIPLPNGFQPEGIATGRGTTFYVGSIPTGAVYRGDLRTGEGEEVKARLLVNAAGPWVDHVLSDPVGLKDVHNVRLVQGSHIVVPKAF